MAPNKAITGRVKSGPAPGPDRWEVLVGLIVGERRSIASRLELARTDYQRVTGVADDGST